MQLQRVVTRRELAAGCQPEFDAYLSGSEPYAQLNSACLQAEQRGVPNADLVPMVSLIVNATLDTLNQPSVAAKLPFEINERQIQAAKCVDRVAKLIEKHRNLPVFKDAYNAINKKTLEQAGGSPDRVSSMLDFYDMVATLGNFASAQFTDVRLLAGGAVRVLEKAGITDEPYAEILTRSKGLLLFARIHKKSVPFAHRMLGEPYADESNLRVEDAAEGITVNFTEEAQQMLCSVRADSQGCPARRIPSPGGVRYSLLQSAWQDTVHYLVPEQATASDNQPVYR